MLHSQKDKATPLFFYQFYHQIYHMIQREIKITHLCGCM